MDRSDRPLRDAAKGGASITMLRPVVTMLRPVVAFEEEP